MRVMDKLLQIMRINKTKPFIPDNAKLMDVGAFDGLLFKKLSNKIANGIGIEPLLKRPHEGDNFRIFPGYFPENTPKTENLDIITMLAVFEHIPHEKQNEVAEKCGELLKKGGKVIITVPSEKVDKIIEILLSLKLSDGMASSNGGSLLEEHYGFHPEDTLKIFDKPYFKLHHRSKFQFGLNNLFVFEKL